MRKEMIGQMVIAIFISMGLEASVIIAQDEPSRKGTVAIRSAGPAKKPVVSSVHVTPAFLEELAKSELNLPPSLSSRSRFALSQVVEQIKKGNTSRAQKYWSDVIRAQPDGDINGLIQWVLREAYMENVENLQYYAEKVKYLNELKRAIRTYLEDLRKAKQRMQREMEREGIIEIEAITCIPTLYQSATQPKPEMTRMSFDRKTLAAYTRNVEDQLSTIGDDAQLASIELQNALQKQQQMAQTLSDVSKMLHDTAIAVIRKMD